MIGLPDEDLGQKLHAIVDIADHPSTLDELTAALRPHLEERLVRYKIPRTFELVHDPVRDDAGKVRRSACGRTDISQSAVDLPSASVAPPDTLGVRRALC